MKSKKGQSWENCDADIKKFVTEIVDSTIDFFKENLTGVYLHGSLAMGSYFRPKSDIDLLIVVEKTLSPLQRKEFSQLTANFSDSRPTVGDIELSIILKKLALNFTHPLPFEVHYSSDWKERIKNNEVDYTNNRTDSDLAAHCFSTQKRGVCLVGNPIKELFPTPYEYYKDAALDDFNWIIEAENILESPFYCVLNCCRFLHLLYDDRQSVISKTEGAKWALENLPSEFHHVIEKALAVYQSSESVTPENRRTGGKMWDKSSLLTFRDFVRAEAEKSPAFLKNLS